MKTAPRKKNPLKRDAGKGRAERDKASGGRPGPARPARQRGGFHTPDRFTLSGRTVGDVCFDCECRILEIGGPDAMILAWCECAWPDDHAGMEIG